MLVVLMVEGLLIGCGKDWQMDYGQPDAQFLQEDVASKGRAFLGKKITVKGTVASVDVSDPVSAEVYLTGGIACNFGEFNAMAESCEVGDTVYIDGVLVRCEEGDILLDPAMLRDPTAPFFPRMIEMPNKAWPRGACPPRVVCFMTSNHQAGSRCAPLGALWWHSEAR
jgi:hypothetical protein